VIFLEGSVLALPKNSPPTRGGWLQIQSRLKPANRVEGCGLWVESCELGLFFESATRNSQPFMSACFSRLRLRSHPLQSVENWRARLLPSRKRQRMANSFFWMTVLLHCQKISAHREMCPPVLSACFSRLCLCRHRLRVGVQKVGGRGFCRAEIYSDRKVSAH